MTAITAIATAITTSFATPATIAIFAEVEVPPAPERLGDAVSLPQISLPRVRAPRPPAEHPHGVVEGKARRNAPCVALVVLFYLYIIGAVEVSVEKSHIVQQKMHQQEEEWLDGWINEQ